MIYTLVTTLQHVLKETHEPTYSKNEWRSFFITKGHVLRFHINISYNNITQNTFYFVILTRTIILLTQQSTASK